MSDSHKGFCLMMLITTAKLEKKAAKLLEEWEIPIAYSINAQGTAPSEIIDMLGLGNGEKKILVTPIPLVMKEDLFAQLYKTLKFHIVNSGIAFSIPLTGASNLIPRMYEKAEGAKKPQGKKGVEMSEVKHSMITVIANRGYSVEIMEAAKAAGASGGSVIKSKSMLDAGIGNLWGLSTQEEKEIILIVSDNEKKVEIMRQISANCGVHSEAKGVVLSFAIDSVMGLQKKKEE